jgi:hypothetical protein
MTPPPPPPHYHYMEALHPTKQNHWQYHWFDVGHIPPPRHTDPRWKPKLSCVDQGCGHWSRCYNCNDFIASLLVDKAEFIARRELETEYPENPHPHPLLLRPHQFCYGTDDVDDQDDPERKKAHNWHTTKDSRVCVIALDIATDPMKSSNKEDLTTTEQVKAELTKRHYHHHKKLSPPINPQNKENNPPSTMRWGIEPIQCRHDSVPCF